MQDCKSWIKKREKKLENLSRGRKNYTIHQMIKNYDSPSYNFSWKRVRLAGIASAACLQLGLGQWDENEREIRVDDKDGE